MAADGTRAIADKHPSKIEWSADPAVLRMQTFVNGFKPGENPSAIDRMFIQLPWFRETKASVDRSLRMAKEARKENCVRGQGPSRAGKTCAGRALIREHMPWRDKDGLHMPRGYLRVPSVPSVSVVGQEVLRALGDSSWDQRRNPVERLARIGEVAEMVGLQALIVDDLHHIVDARGSRVQHTVADLFIDIGNETAVPLVFLGLNRMGTIFEVNEQLRGRTGAPIQYLRLDWRNKKNRELFTDALNSVTAVLRESIPFDKSMDDGTLMFRMYCSTGGLLGYLVLILRVAEDMCRGKKIPLGFEALRRAVGVVVGKESSWPGKRDPFHPEFVIEATKESLDAAQAVGKESGPAARKSGAPGSIGTRK
ncbi:TniB family NTP-binding protein [Arenimonas sp. MALMAid1274]|uniref:TniB family NTP-binding protein n=1 Tax=Arenimonas sp. MALMAid1274 TaxID=3411630 RepID=UPI003BA07451